MSETIISSVILCPNPMCKYTNPLKSKFCMQCGSPLADAANDGKKVKIVVLENQKVLQEFSLTDKSIVGKSGDISVKGADFSENICEFKMDGEKVFLNVMSENVFVKANINKTLELVSGTEIKIGDKTFRVEM
ncbi:MAG: hypothetical protein IPG24_09555 [Leptospiraceae bacterium]|nr:hypothetical protein [Leptospiraceae bacterium]